MVAKNRCLQEENAKLTAKCSHLEDLLNEEETDINDILELIKKMQVKTPGAAAAAVAAIGPISKFRELQVQCSKATKH